MEFTLQKPFLIFLFTHLCTINDAQEMFPGDPNIAELTPLNFETLVLQNHDLWIVDFYAPWCGYCKNLVPELEKTASALKGVVKVGALNADNYVAIGERYDVTSYPTIKVFGYYKSHPEDFKGERTFKSFAFLAMSAVKRKVHAQFEEYQFTSAAGPNIVLLDDSKFNAMVISSKNVWFVKFYAPWSNHSKAFLPLWRKTAEKMRGDAKFGILDGSLHGSKVQQYQIEGYPTIIAFAPHRNTPYHYSGRRDAKSVVEWVLEMLEYFQQPGETKVSMHSKDRREDDEDYHRDSHDDEL